jgi:hypothetical protein
MRSTCILAWTILLATGLCRADAGEPLAFRVKLDEAASTESMSGRIVVFLLREGARGVSPRATPADAPFYDDPQPIYAMDVRDLKPGGVVEIADDADAFPAKPSDLPAGKYKVQAILDAGRDNSDWKREPGNVYSEVLPLAREPGAGLALEIPLTKRVEAEEPEPGPGGEVFEVRSKLLSAFRGRDVLLRAGVVFPSGVDTSKRYAAVYVVPGFGGDHAMARQYLRMRQRGMGDASLNKAAFTIVLDPESGNGHTLFADSPNNGPVGRALVEELIPALEARYQLIGRPTARIVTGHSSGGWSSLWLALTYPETFGACWSGSPDPVDFHAFQKINLYEASNFYTDAAGREIPSNLQGDKVLMTIRQENQWEQVRGPANTSGQQWDSWQAVFGLRDERGNPAALFDTVTGAIDKRTVEAYRAFDITDRLRNDPERYLPIFRDHIRIIVGDKDEWNLHAAVRLLRDALVEQGLAMDGVVSFGKVTIVPNTDHGTVMMTPDYRAMSTEMFEWFKKAGHAE